MFRTKKCTDEQKLIKSIKQPKDTQTYSRKSDHVDIKTIKQKILKTKKRKASGPKSSLAELIKKGSEKLFSQ